MFPSQQADGAKFHAFVVAEPAGCLITKVTVQFRPNAIALQPSAVPTQLFCLANLIQSRPWTVNPQGVRSYCDLSGCAAEVTAVGPGSNGRHRAGIGPANGWSLTCRISTSHKTTHSILPGP